MKVLLISNMYPSTESPHYGVFVYRTEKTLIDYGVDVSKVTLNKPKGIIVKCLSYIAFYIRVIYQSLFYQYDYIYVHYVSHCALPLLFAICFKKNINIVSHVHGGDVKYHSGRQYIFFKLKSLLSKKLLSASKRIISPSEYYKKLLVDDYLINPSSITIYPSGGIDLSLFDISKDLARPINKIGFAGRFVKSKNVELIVDVFAELIKVDRDLLCEFVGEGPEKEKLQKKVNKLGIADNVTFYPSKSSEKLSEWYKKIDILIYPSESESLGLVPLEAMASGAIVVLSNIPAFKEFVSSTNGYLCDDKTDYINTVKNIISLEQTKLIELKLSARTTIENKYCKEKVSKRLYESFT